MKGSVQERRPEAIGDERRNSAGADQNGKEIVRVQTWPIHHNIRILPRIRSPSSQESVTGPTQDYLTNPYSNLSSVPGVEEIDEMAFPTA